LKNLDGGLTQPPPAAAEVHPDDTICVILVGQDLAPQRSGWGTVALHQTPADGEGHGRDALVKKSVAGRVAGGQAGDDVCRPLRGGGGEEGVVVGEVDLKPGVVGFGAAADAGGSGDLEMGEEDSVHLVFVG
jgi:hypothetical protein